MTYPSLACSAMIEAGFGGAVTGIDVTAAPAAHGTTFRDCRHLSRPGMVSSAGSAVSSALRDRNARLLNVAAAELVRPARESVGNRWSGGLTPFDDEQTLAQLEHRVEDRRLDASAGRAAQG